MARRCLILPAALAVLGALTVAPATSPLAAQTWTGAANDGGNWNNAANWNPMTVPNSNTADAVFGPAGVGNVSVLSSVSARSLTFSNPSGSYNLNATAAFINSVQSITVSSAVTGTQTINLNDGGILGLEYLGGAGLMITNSSSGASLVIAGRIDGSVSGDKGMTVAGPGAVTISGKYAANGFGGVSGALTMTGPGTLTLSGDGSAYHEGLTISGGATILDFSSNTAAKINGGNLTSTGGALGVAPNGSTAVAQSFAATALMSGDMEVFNTGSAGATVSIGLGPVTRSAGATFTEASGRTFTTTTANTNGLWGNGPAFATLYYSTSPSGYGGFWATNSGGTLVALPNGPINSFSSGTNSYVVGTTSPSSFTTNSLEFDVGNTTLTLSGINTLQSGGILVTVHPEDFGGQPPVISGGTLASGVNELIVHAYSGITINSNITASSGLTKTGSDTLSLGGFNSGLTGPININAGTLAITTANAVNSASAIKFNPGSQQLIVQLGDGVSGTVSPPIQLAGSPYFANFGANSVTLSGVISSPGPCTQILFQGSGFDLTAVNTFTAPVVLFSGTLGITADANLGNAANLLQLQVNSTTAGGLLFLNGGINIAHSIEIDSPTRIISNGGDINTISGPVSEVALFKDGTGTLVLSGANSQNGVTIIAGTVSVASDANLGAANAAVSINSGATLATTGTLANGRPIAIGPLSGNVVGTSTIDVAAGQTLTLNGAVSGTYGALLKTSPGTLVLANIANTYGGGTTVQAGGLQVAADGSLGTAGTPVSVSGAGTLTFTGSSASARTFNLNTGTLAVPFGVTLTLNGASTFGGFLRGAGTVVVTGGTALTGMTTFASTAINQTGAGSYANFTNGSPLTIAGGLASPVLMSGFTNEGSGSITVGANTQITAADFQTYGTLTLSPGSAAVPTQLTNTGASNLFFNGGSRTFISIPANAGQFDAGIDLHGQNAVVAGGLFVNNGYVVDSAGLGKATIVADFGSLVKGAGFYQNSVQTVNGGKFQSGNSPGKASFGSFTFGPGGVTNYVFAIDDATGTAGPGPDANGHVSGWGLVKTVRRPIGGTTTAGDFAWTATPTNKLTVLLDTLINPTTVGSDVVGPMADFDATKPYAWLAASWAGNYSGPTDPAALDAATAFDTSGFQNLIEGTFGWRLDAGGHSLSLTYAPSAVPEPGTLVLTGFASFGLLMWSRRSSRFRSTIGNRSFRRSSTSQMT